MDFLDRACMWLVTREFKMPKLSHYQYRLEKFLKRTDVTQTPNYVEASKVLGDFFYDIEQKLCKK